MGMDQARRPQAKTVAVATGAALAVVLSVGWWTTRSKSAPPSLASADERVASASARGTEPESPAPPARAQPELEAPQGEAPVRKARRQQPPRFVRVPPPPPARTAQTGHELAKDNPHVLAAISGAAHGEQVTEAEYRAGGQCIRDLARRNPELVDSTDTVRGMFIVTVSTKGQEGRVMDMEGRGNEDREMFDCLRKARAWLSGRPFPAPGAPDGTTKIEWPYRVRVGARPRAAVSPN